MLHILNRDDPYQIQYALVSSLSAPQHAHPSLFRKKEVLEDVRSEIDDNDSICASYASEMLSGWLPSCLVSSWFRSLRRMSIPIHCIIVVCTNQDTQILHAFSLLQSPRVVSRHHLLLTTNFITNQLFFMCDIALWTPYSFRSTIPKISYPITIMGLGVRNKRSYILMGMSWPKLSVRLQSFHVL